MHGRIVLHYNIHRVIQQTLWATNIGCVFIIHTHKYLNTLVSFCNWESQCPCDKFHQTESTLQSQLFYGLILKTQSNHRYFSNYDIHSFIKIYQFTFRIIDTCIIGYDNRTEQFRSRIGVSIHSYISIGSISIYQSCPRILIDLSCIIIIFQSSN